MVVWSIYSGVDKMEDCYSECQALKAVSATFPLVDMKVSIQHNSTWLSTSSRFIFLCVSLGEEKC